MYSKCGIMGGSTLRKGPMMAKVTLNPDAEMVALVKDGLKRTGGYCPCKIDRSEATRCMCDEFKAQIADEDFEGFCHCLLYYKSKED